MRGKSWETALPARCQRPRWGRRVKCETFSEGEVFTCDSLDEQLVAGKGGAVPLLVEVLETLAHNLARFTKVVDNEVEKRDSRLSL